MSNQGRSNNLWNGNDRRNYHDRRDETNQPPQPSYFEQMILEYLQDNQPASNNSKYPKLIDNLGQGTLTLTQIGGIIVVLGSLTFSGFSVWGNLNKELDIQKNNLTLFKESINKDVDLLQKNVIELKRLSEDMKVQQQKSSDSLERRISDLDSTVAQIYQKVSSKK